MPVSEDEIEMAGPQEMTKAELRKSNKPIMEKRRRARINHCLNELKSLILEALKKDPARHSKLEKADILEMTVKHLQAIQRQQLAVAMASDPAVLKKFRSGFSECATEVSRYIARLGNVDEGVKQRLLAHLGRCIQQMSPAQAAANAEDVNNNQSGQNETRIQGLRLIPSRLPSGELALLLPNSSTLPFFPHLSAFSAVCSTAKSTTTTNSSTALSSPSPPFKVEESPPSPVPASKPPAEDVPKEKKLKERDVNRMIRLEIAPKKPFGYEAPPQDAGLLSIAPAKFHSSPEPTAVASSSAASSSADKDMWRPW